MSEVSKLHNIEPQLETELRNLIGSWHHEITAKIPGLSDDVQIEFDNNCLVPDSPTGGATWSPKLIKLAYDNEFDASKKEKMFELKATYSHECYHVFRNYSFETTPIDQSAIGIAIEEGLATKFEMTFTGSHPGYAAYEDRNTMLSWLKEVMSLPNGFDYNWQKYKFYDEETGRKWILYKVGLFIVDEAIGNSREQTLKSLNNLTVEQILAESKLLQFKS